MFQTFLCFDQFPFQKHFLQEFTLLPPASFAKPAWSMFGVTNANDLNSKDNY